MDSQLASAVSSLLLLLLLLLADAGACLLLVLADAGACDCSCCYLPMSTLPLLVTAYQSLTSMMTGHAWSLAYSSHHDMLQFHILI